MLQRIQFQHIKHVPLRSALWLRLPPFAHLDTAEVVGRIHVSCPPAPRELALEILAVGGALNVGERVLALFGGVDVLDALVQGAEEGGSVRLLVLAGCEGLERVVAAVLLAVWIWSLRLGLFEGAEEG